MHAEDTSDVLQCQLHVLKFFGIVPFSQRSSSTSSFKSVPEYVRLCVDCCLFNGAVIVFVLLSAATALDYAAEREKGQTSPFVLLLAMLPTCFFCLRGLAVLLHAIQNRGLIRNILKTTDVINRANFDEEDLDKTVLSQWKTAAVFMFVLTLTLRISWNCIGWWGFVNEVDSKTKPSRSRDHVWAPFPLRVTLFEYVMMWTIFSSIPFFISQQIFVLLLMLAWICGSCVKQLVLEIESVEKSCKASCLVLAIQKSV